MCLSLPTSSVCFHISYRWSSSSVFSYLSVSKNRQVGIEIIQVIICVVKVEKTLEGLYFLRVCLCLPSSCYFVYSLYFRTLATLGEPYYSSTRSGSSTSQWTLDEDCLDSQAQFIGYRNQLEAVQVQNIHSARCSLYMQLGSYPMHFRWRSQWDDDS